MRSPRARRSSSTWTATSAAAARTTASSRRFNARRRRPDMDRRQFLQTSGALSFVIAIGGDGLQLIPEAQASTPQPINAWVRIAPDGTVTILSAGAEMGQGSMTSLPLIVAEEMDADWSKVKIEFAPADASVYGYTFQNAKAMAIVGSRAVMYYFNDLRTAGAQVRKVLIANAADKWGVDAKTLKTEPGFVVDGAGRKLSYGEIASFAKVPSPLPAVDKSELKSKDQYRLIGKAMPRRDIPPKVNGTAQYAMDVQLPGMVYATARHAPVHGAAPESWNDAKVKSMKGVIGTVKLPDGVAIIADSLPHAMAARRALEVKWNKGDAAGYDSEAVLQEGYAKVHADPAAKSQTLEAKGDPKTAFSAAAKTYKAEFRSDYGYHAQMEPLNAVARLNAAGDHVEVWEGTQDPASSRTAIAKAVGFKEEQVTLHQCYMGGGFGRRSLGHVFNVFAIESFVDQMALDANMDPIAFRMERMAATPRARAVFEKVAQMSDWKAPRPEGRALGVSISERSGSLGAGVAEVSIDKSSGKIRVHKAWVAVDGGLVVQPEMARANIESGILHGLSSVLHERLTIKGGEVQQSNFHDYHLLHMSDVPELMQVEFVERDAPPSGLGEIGNPWVAAAVANAVYRLTGKRLTHMPFTPERVKQTLSA